MQKIQVNLLDKASNKQKKKPLENQKKIRLSEINLIKK